MNFNLKWNTETIIIAILVLMGAFYFVSRNRKIEGFSNASRSEYLAKGLLNDITSLEDSLYISKYKTNYKDIVNDLSKWCDLQILNVIISNKIDAKGGFDTKNTEIITSLNQYREFKNTLEQVYDNLLN